MRDTKSLVREAYERLGGNVSAVARELGVSRGTVHHHARKLGLGKKPLVDGTVDGLKTESWPLPRRGQVKRYIVTSAQNNTSLNQPVWRNLVALAEHFDAQILVGTFSYNKQAYGKLSVKRGTKRGETTELDMWFAEELLPHIIDKRVELAPGLVWCGEINILPTAKRPLSGFETYTGRKSGIFPHAKFAMQSVASMPEEPTKFNYTTGTVTKKNYIQKRAGLAAEHAHGYGGLMVEVDDKGRWFVRQLSADSKGKLYDLDVMVEGGVVYENERVAAITWGDIHSALLDEVVREIAWGEGGMLDTLRPEFQFMHDVLAGLKINHHEWRNPHEQFRLHVEGWDSVHDELVDAAAFLSTAERDWCSTQVVWSNHDSPWIERWLRECDYRQDPKNAELFLELQHRKYRAIREKDTDFNILEYALRNRGCPEDTEFLGESDSFTICRGQIECGMHGHLGPDGARGVPLGLSKMGRKANTAQTHSAGITDGLYVAGSSTRMSMGFNRGPSSWSHSHIVTYPNGKRAIVTMWDGKWRAEN